MNKELFDSLINYLKAHNIPYESCVGIVVIVNKVKEKTLSISIDERVIGDCKFKWCIKHKSEIVSKMTHSNFSHLTNTVIRIFLE